MKTRHWLVLGWSLCVTCAASLMVIAAPSVGQARTTEKQSAWIGAQGPDLGGWHTFRSDSVDNLASAVAYSGRRDEYMVVWEDHNASEVAVYGRRADHTGYPQGSAVQIAHYATYTSCEPSVAYGPLHDRYLVVYAQDSKPSLPPGTDYNIIGQPVNGDGTITETGFLIDGKFPVHQRRPAVVYNSTYDEFLVVWEEEQGAGGWHDIWAQRINASDWSMEPGPVCIATGDSLHRLEPDAAYNEVRNDYIIAYTRDVDIFAKVVDAGLTSPLTISETEIIYNTNYQEHVAAASGSDGFLLVWQDGPSPSWRTIYARRVAASGEAPEPPFLIAEETNKVCSSPDVAFGLGLGFLVTWECDYGANGHDSHGRYVTPGAGGSVLDEFTIDDDPNVQTDTAVACNPFGDCLFVESDNSGSADYEINGRMVTPLRLDVPVTLRDG